MSFYTGLLGGIGHVFFCYIFISKLELGINGLGLAMTCTQSVVYAAMLIYTRHIPEIKDALIPADSRVFNDIKTYLKLALPSYIMLALDWWVWEMMCLIAGYLGVDE